AGVEPPARPDRRRCAGARRRLPAEAGDPRFHGRAAPGGLRGIVRLDEIQIRDPFVLDDDGRYWLFGSTDANIWDGPATGFDTYWSLDLEEWHGPVPAFRPHPDFWSHTQYWAPEVHRYRGAYYM